MGTIDLLKKLEEKYYSMEDKCTCATDEEMAEGASAEWCPRCKIGNFLNRLSEEINDFIDYDLGGL